MSLKGGFYSQVVMIRRSIMKTKATKENLVEDQDQKNGSAMNYKNEDENDMNITLVKDKYKTRLSEENKDKEK